MASVISIISRDLIFLQKVVTRKKIKRISFELTATLLENNIDVRTLTRGQIEQWSAFAKEISGRLVKDETTNVTFRDCVNTVINYPYTLAQPENDAPRDAWDSYYESIIMMIEEKQSPANAAFLHGIYCDNTECPRNKNGMCKSDGPLDVSDGKVTCG